MTCSCQLISWQEVDLSLHLILCFSIWKPVEIGVQVGRETSWEREENGLFILKGLLKTARGRMLKG